ncbi:MAG: hypothetical protein PHR11_06480 [Candidatus Omnitrophica bacterium]|nr:hypothetical protein [Candidatus Omnitrophota bacterium]
MRKLGFPLLLAAVILALYRPMFGYPFISDDWIALHQFSTMGLRESLQYIFKFSTVFDYRPLGYLYSFLVFKAFGLQAPVFRAFLLFFHFLNGIILARVIERILHERFIARVAAIMYVASTAVHLQPLSWPFIGISDLGGMFFFLLSFWFFLQNRRVFSVLFLGAALFVKPSTCMLPVILFIYLVSGMEGERLSFKEAWKKLWLHFMMLLPFTVSLIFYAGISISNNLERFSPSPVDLFRNSFYFYYKAPFTLFPSNPGFAVIAMLLACLVFFRRGKRFGSGAAVPGGRRACAFIFSWFIIALVPVAVLRNSAELSYYLTYSWPAFLLLFLFFFRRALRCFDYSAQREKFFIFLLACFFVFSSGVYLYSEDSKKLDSKEQMVRGAYFLNTIRPRLQNAWPALPEKVTLVFTGIDSNINIYWYFAQAHHALRTWYGNETIEVCKLEDIFFTPSGMIFDPSDDCGLIIQPDSGTHFYLVDWNKGDPVLRATTPKELQELRAVL